MKVYHVEVKEKDKYLFTAYCGVLGLRYVYHSDGYKTVIYDVNGERPDLEELKTKMKDANRSMIYW